MTTTSATNSALGTIGVAGCGRMGLPMAQALLRHGLPCLGFDVRPASHFVELDVHFTNDPNLFAAKIQTLVSVVRDAAQTESLLFGEQGILNRPHGIKTLVISSTLSPHTIHALRDRVSPEIAMVDAPMSGAAIAAREARLSFMLGGDDHLINALSPMFSAMGTRHHRLGALGAGMTAKVLNNLVAAASTAATRKALSLAKAFNLDETALRAVMHDSSGQTWFGSNFDQIEFGRDGFDPENTIGILVKDVQCAVEAADSVGHDMALAQALITELRTLKPQPT